MLLFWRQILCHCSQPNFELHITSRVYAYLRGGFWKRRNTIPLFRKTGRHIATLTLEQMWRLFYLKRASVRLHSSHHVDHFSLFLNVLSKKFTYCTSTHEKVNNNTVRIQHRKHWQTILHVHLQYMTYLLWDVFFYSGHLMTDTSTSYYTIITGIDA